MFVRLKIRIFEKKCNNLRSRIINTTNDFKNDKISVWQAKDIVNGFDKEMEDLEDTGDILSLKHQSSTFIVTCFLNRVSGRLINLERLVKSKEHKEKESILKESLDC